MLFRSSNSISKHLGEGNIKRVVNWVMKYLAEELEDLPIKRGTFIEFRSGMLVSCSNPPFSLNTPNNEGGIFVI